MTCSYPTIEQFLSVLCGQGEWQIGQIAVLPGPTLRHTGDVGVPGLAMKTKPTDARDIAKYDDAGTYRPLKTAPNLRHGWELRLTSIADLRLALDFFYPAAVGTWLAQERGDLRPVPFRATLSRQTGMYRVTQLIRDDQAVTLIGQTCHAGCLRRILWPLADGQDPQTEGPPQPCSGVQRPATAPGIPLLCAEACNLLVAAARPIAKGNLPPK